MRRDLPPYNINDPRVFFISRKPQDFLKPRKKEESFEVQLAYHVFKADTIRRTEVDRNFEYSANFAGS